MASDSDDILMGEETLRTREAVDSDGDGVSDIQERLDGTDASDAADFRRQEPELVEPTLTGIDPQAGLDPAVMERMTTFDAVGSPGGQTIENNLANLTNVDGTALTFTTDHDGVGDDALLTGRLGDSPLDMQRDPTQTSVDYGSAPADDRPTMTTADGKGSGNTFTGADYSIAPDGAALSYNAPDTDLVSAKPKTVTVSDLGDELVQLKKQDPNVVNSTTTEDLGDGYTKEIYNTTNAKTGASVTYETVYDDGQPGASKTTTVSTTGKVTTEYWKDPNRKPVKGDVNPDADFDVVVTQEVLDRAVTLAGADTTPVQDDIAPPAIEGDAPTLRRGDLVTDGGGEIDGVVDLGGTTPLSGDPSAPVINTINPDSGFSGPEPGTGGGAGTTGNPDTSMDAATAVHIDEPVDDGISLVGSSGTSGISSTVPDGADDILGSSPVHDTATPISFAEPDPGDAATYAFSASFLDDAEPLEPDFTDTGLTSDLTADLAPTIDEPMPDPLLETHGDDFSDAESVDDDGLDDGLG